MRFVLIVLYGESQFLKSFSPLHLKRSPPILLKCDYLQAGKMSQMQPFWLLVPEGRELRSRFNKDFAEYFTLQKADSVTLLNLHKRVTYVYTSVKYFLGLLRL